MAANPLLNYSQPGQRSSMQNDMMENFLRFKQALQNSNPQAIANYLIQTGQMSQAQFQQYAQLANQILGGQTK